MDLALLTQMASGSVAVWCGQRSKLTQIQDVVQAGDGFTSGSVIFQVQTCTPVSLWAGTVQAEWDTNT